MNITCPSCGCHGDLALFMADREFREAVLAASALPSNCGSLVLRYIGLFRPLKRQLSAARASKIIAEVNDLIQAKETKLGHERANILAHTWAQALEATLENDKLTRPLKNHHYLIRVALNKVKQFEALGEAQAEDTPNPERSKSGMQSMATVLDDNQEEDNDDDVIEEQLRNMSSDERKALHQEAIEKLRATGIKEAFIITPMIHSMMGSILRGLM